MILYFSGTGNSRYAAKLIADVTGDEIISLGARIKGRDTSAISSKRPLVFVCPVYAGRIPRIVEEHIRETSFEGTKEAYFVVTCAQTPWDTVGYAKKLCADKGLALAGFNSVIMPQNYIVMGGIKSETENEKILRNAAPKIKEIAELIKAEKPLSPQSPGKKMMSIIINPVMYFLMISAKKFYATDACTQCKDCVKRCPLNNIKMENAHPAWGAACTHCMACIGGCPVQAIEYGKKTHGKPRYYKLPMS